MACSSPFALRISRDSRVFGFKSPFVSRLKKTKATFMLLDATLAYFPFEARFHLRPTSCLLRRSTEAPRISFLALQHLPVYLAPFFVLLLE